MGGTVVTELKEIVWEGLDWINLVHDRDKWRAVLKRQWTYVFRKIQEIFD